MNNRHYTEIAFVLDRSGSMQSCRDAAITGFNQFLAEQQMAEGLAKLTLVLFDNEYLVPVRSIPVSEVVPLDTTTYVPRNTTALLDAIGQTIDDLGSDLAARDEKNRPGQIIVAIFTDGLENASERFTLKEVAAKIEHQTDAYKWTFLFLGANQDAIATAAQMNIGAANAATYAADGPGARSAHRSFARKVSALRASSLGEASVAEQADAAAPMSEILAEEDKKQRGSSKAGGKSK